MIGICGHYRGKRRNFLIFGHDTSCWTWGVCGMTDYLPKDVVDGLEAAGKRGLKRRSA